MDRTDGPRDRCSSGTRLPCPSCPDTFARPEHLTRHLRKHTGEKPFICKWCRKQFARSDSMKRHETLHSKVSESSKSNNHVSSQQTSPVAESLAGGTSYSIGDSAPVVSKEPDQIGHDTLTHLPTQAAWRPPMGDHGSVASVTEANAQDPSYGALQDFDPLDPAVMSNVNWLPLGRPSELDLNAFNLFWDPSQDWTVDFSTPGPTQTATVGNSSLGAYAPSLARETHSPPHENQEDHSLVYSPPCSTVTSSSKPFDEQASPSFTYSGRDSRGESYVNSGVTRLAKGQKRRTSIQNEANYPNHAPRKSKYGFTFSQDMILGGYSSVYISPRTYDLMIKTFSKTCTSKQSGLEPFESDSFLGLEAIDRLVSLAVDHFLPTLPFIHKTVLSMKDRHWTLYLAMAVIGSRYESNVIESNVNSITEFVRRTFARFNEQQFGVDTILDIAQAKTLMAISLLYSGNLVHQNAGKSILRELVSYCDQEWISDRRSVLEISWLSWVLEESRNRTVHVIWLIDCMTSYQFSTRLLLDLEDATVPLPCHETLWQTSNKEELSCLDIAVNPALTIALETLYLEKRIQPTIGEFGRILLIHGLYRQTWDVMKQAQSRLLAWEPHAKAQQSVRSTPVSAPDSWAPGIPLYAKWRNAACDCLDVLHWQANSVIGAKSGQEHPTVLFLHFARVVLLSPLESIKIVANSATAEKSSRGEKLTQASAKLARWAYQDCYKARLAIIHAGVLMYHVRRHSLDSFYEPSAVFLSVLCLWAYASAHANQIPDESIRNGEILDADGIPLPELIHLDRPCDDELVQLFITNGNKIKPNITGVGDLCALEGPRKMLKLGCVVLRNTKNWDTRCHYENILLQLQSRSIHLEQQIIARNAPSRQA